MMNAGHVPRTEHLGRKLLRNRLSQRLIIAKLTSTLRYQGSRRSPVGRKTNQVTRDKTAGMRKRPVLGIKRNNQSSLNMIRPAGCLDSVGGEHLDATALELLGGILGFRRPVSRVNNRYDPEAGTEQLSGETPTCLIMTDNNGSGTGLYAIQVQQSPDTAAEHDAR